MNSKKPILITGSHRSGTTWVGKVIAQNDNIKYIQEPFNIQRNNDLPFLKYWYQFPTQNNQNEIQEYIESYLYESSFLKKMWAKLQRNKEKRNLIKDPISFFSAEWLASTFDMDVVIIVRHPAAFISSLKRLGWEHPFDHFIEQPELMKTILFDFKDELEEFSKNKKDIIDQGILLWKLLYSTVLSYQVEHPEWYIVRHEDLSLNPEEEFEKMLDFLNIRMTDKIQKYIQKTTNDSNATDAATNVVHQLNRNSQENIKVWKNRLTEDEINRIKDGVESVSKFFYTDSDW